MKNSWKRNGLLLATFTFIACAGIAGCEKAPPQGSTPVQDSPNARTAPTTETPKAASTPAEPVKSTPKTETASVPAGAAENTAGPWKVPFGWTFDATPKPMRIATYVAPTSSGNVEVAVTRFPEKVGGELANINRWRGQMGLPTIDAAGLEATITRFSAAGFEGYETRIESEKGVMMASAVFDKSSNHTWFVRATAKDAKQAEEIKGNVFGMARSILESKPGK